MHRTVGKIGWAMAMHPVRSFKAEGFDLSSTPSVRGSQSAPDSPHQEAIRTTNRPPRSAVAGLGVTPSPARLRADQIGAPV